MNSTAALISGLVASRATRNATWLCLSATKVLFSEITGARSTCIRRDWRLGLGVGCVAWLMRRPLPKCSYIQDPRVGLRSHESWSHPRRPGRVEGRKRGPLGDLTPGDAHGSVATRSRS